MKASPSAHLPPEDAAPEDATVAYSEGLLAPKSKAGTSVKLSSRERPSHYVLAGEIASGGMASVHVALQSGAEGFHRVVAIKRIHPHLAQHREFCEMFIDEARIAARINHPNVCRIFDFGRNEDGYFLAMEYLAGEPLSRVVRKLRDRPELRGSARYPLIVARIFADLAEGLHAAHTLTSERGERLDVVHRDATPQNLFVLYDGTVRVTDFGIALARQRVHHTRGELLKGKLSYMAPEQLQRQPVDQRADVWALGVALWESLTSRKLFAGQSEGETLMQVVSQPIEPPSLLNPRVPIALDAVLERALERTPEGRYQSARELARDLERCLSRASDTVPTMDLAEWMRDLFPGGAERAAQLVSTALLRSSLPPSLAPPVEINVIPELPPLPEEDGAPSLARQRRRAKQEATQTSAAAAASPADPDGEKTTGVFARASNAVTSPNQARPSRRALLLGLGACACALAIVAVGRLMSSQRAAGAHEALDAPKAAHTEVPRVAPPPAVSAAAPLSPGQPTVSAAAQPIALAEASPKPEPSAANDAKLVATAAPTPKRVTRSTVEESAPRPVGTLTGSVSVTASQGAGEVFENGVLLGRTPARLSLPPGKHFLMVRPLGGGPSRGVTVDVTAGGMALVTLALPASSGAAPGATSSP